jgi:mRNA-degrading endonuclease RelE of RelBE toxin-antitoxin system
MIFEELTEFRKDIKKLSKKYKTIPEDIEIVKKVLTVYPDERPPFSYRLDGLGIESCIIKVKKIASKSFKGKGIGSGFRMVYAHFDKEERIVFIELFHTSEKEIEDTRRIDANFK